MLTLDVTTNGQTTSSKTVDLSMDGTLCSGGDLLARSRSDGDVFVFNGGVSGTSLTGTMTLDVDPPTGEGQCRLRFRVSPYEG